MIDRRIFIVLVVAAAGVAAGRAVLTGPADPLVELDVRSEQAPSTSTDRIVAGAELDEADLKRPVTSPTPAETPRSEPPSDLDIADLVAQRRPTIDRVETAHAHHPPDGEQDPTSGGDATTVKKSPRI